MEPCKWLCFNIEPCRWFCFKIEPCKSLGFNIEPCKWLYLNMHVNFIIIVVFVFQIKCIIRTKQEIKLFPCGRNFLLFWSVYVWLLTRQDVFDYLFRLCIVCPCHLCPEDYDTYAPNVHVCPKVIQHLSQCYYTFAPKLVYTLAHLNFMFTCSHILLVFDQNLIPLLKNKCTYT